MILHWFQNAICTWCIIDLLGYRKYGHNEGDGLVLQPVLYKIIAKHKNLEIFMRIKMADGIIDATM
jgi:2-oxoglutarate dehydrogenase E1 component